MPVSCDYGSVMGAAGEQYQDATDVVDRVENSRPVCGFAGLDVFRAPGPQQRTGESRPTRRTVGLDVFRAGMLLSLHHDCAIASVEPWLATAFRMVMMP